MRVCKYLNQRVRRIGEQNGKSFKGVSKTNKQTKPQFNIEFLLPFNGCRKVLGKMPALKFCCFF